MCPIGPKKEDYMPTTENLQEAFAGESQANRKYLAFAKKADQEGYPQVARLFRAAAAAETVHAHAHLRVLGGVKSTAENVQAAIDGEGFEFQEMYPKFVAEAEKEGNSSAAMSFQYAMAVEEVHHGLYSDAKKALAGGTDLPAASIWICPICGNTFVGTAPEKCPVCGTPKRRYEEIK
jgi:rubrerythrin